MIRIRELRKQKGYTLDEFSNMLGIARATLGFWEQGKFQPSNDMLIRLSRIFGVSVDYLLGGDPITEGDLKVALFGGDGEVTEEMWQEVKDFAQFIKGKRK